MFEFDASQMQMAVIHFLRNRMKNITNIPLSNIKTEHLPNNRKCCLKFDLRIY